EGGLAAKVDVQHRYAAGPRRRGERLELRNDTALLHLHRQHAAEPTLADVRFVDDVVLHLDEQQGHAVGAEGEVAHLVRVSGPHSTSAAGRSTAAPGRR